MKYYVAIMDKTRTKLTDNSGNNLNDDGTGNFSNYSVSDNPGTIVIDGYHKSMNREIDFIENVTVTETDAFKVNVSNDWKINVVETGEPH